jgi:hypothetical protein
MVCRHGSAAARVANPLNAHIGFGRSGEMLSTALPTETVDNFRVRSVLS